MSIACVILNYNGMRFLPDCLRDLHRQDCGSLQIIVSDNGSSDDSIHWIRHQYPEVDIIENNANLGWATGNNVGIRRALERGAEWVWVINYDVEIESDCLSKLLDHAVSRQLGIVGPLIPYYEPGNEIWSYGGRYDAETFFLWHVESLDEFKALPNQNRFVSGCAMLIRKEVFDQIGFFDERLFMYCEDADFCVRAALAGFGIDVVGEAKLYHKAHYQGSGSGQPRGSPFIRYHNVRSGLVFWRKHAGWWRYHREYCHRFLGKWVLPIPDLYREPSTRPLAEATIDGIWGAMIPQLRARPRIHSPAWFRHLMVTRPWLIAELLAWRWPFRRR